MASASLKDIKNSLVEYSNKDLLDLCLKLARIKKENKEYLSYLIFDSSDEQYFIDNLKEELLADFSVVNTKNVYYLRKGLRKILNKIKKYIRFSKRKETEVQLLIFFCSEMIKYSSFIRRSTVLRNMYNRQIQMIEKAIGLLHEDLQYDYNLQIEKLRSS